MIFIPIRRATVLYPSGPTNDPDRLHLAIIMTDPDESGEVILVTVSSIRDGIPHDDACILNPGDHGFIRRPSYVEYRFAQFVEAEKLNNGVRSGAMQAMDMLDEQVFKRVSEGLLQSLHTAPLIKSMFQFQNAQ